METITVEAKLDRKEYIDLGFNLLYRKPRIMFATVLGVICILYATLWPVWIGISNNNTLTGILLSFGILTIYMPFGMYQSNKKKFDSSKLIQLATKYSFSATRVSTENELATITFVWAAVSKVLETEEWILIYRDGNTGNILPKKVFATGQLEQFKTMLRSIPNLKLDLKK